MATETQKRRWHNVPIHGNWTLKYIVTNSLGNEAFGGRHLGIYDSPYDGTKVYARDVNYNVLKGFMIDNLVMRLYPDEKPNDALMINWLIAHPEVTVVGVKNLDKEILKAKDETGKIILSYDDNLELEQIDEEDFIDKVIGTLSLEAGPNAIGLTRLRYILAQLNMSYYIPRFEKAAEKKALRSKLKSFVRKSVQNAKIVSDIISNLDNAQEHYEFKEMVRLKVLEFYNGIYKFNNQPCGDSFARVQAFMNDHPEVKATMLSVLHERLEAEK